MAKEQKTFKFHLIAQLATTLITVIVGGLIVYYASTVVSEIRIGRESNIMQDKDIEYIKKEVKDIKEVANTGDERSKSNFYVLKDHDKRIDANSKVVNSAFSKSLEVNEKYDRFMRNKYGSKWDY